MPTDRTPLLDGRVRVLELARFHDERGSLVPLSFDEAGFTAARVFVVNAPRGSVRGGHAHRRVRQVLLRASGSIEVEVLHGDERARVTLDESCPAILVEAGVWAQQTYLDDHSALVVFADGPYDEREYVHERPDATGQPS
ncbi:MULTISPECIES: sugar 3,4-ketoisomerase [unclassified Agromyces]|uniref:sugar 3,4-ketoisomerase n=1 Tax=unclassified Agromyces TaxID=2639701 RepID=UPI00301545E0